MARRLSRAFFARDVVEVARDLLGARLVRTAGGGTVAGIIVETEAYRGTDDPASHAWGGRTQRNASLFGPPGHAYVYFTYGMHHCLNVVAGRPGEPGGVLIRAIRPTTGLRLMARRRGVAPDARARLAAGPGMVCQAFAISRDDDGRDMLEGPLRVARGEEIPVDRVRRTARIGIRRAVDLPWRFVVTEGAIDTPRGAP